MVAALPGRNLKCSNLSGTKEGKQEKETRRNGKNEKEIEKGVEKKGNKEGDKRKGWRIGKEDENVYKETKIA